MKKAQAGLIGLVMMVAGIALVLGLGAVLLAGALLVMDSGGAASTASLPTSSDSDQPSVAAASTDPSVAVEPAAPEGEKLALGVVAGSAEDASANADSDGDGQEVDEESEEAETPSTAEERKTEDVAATKEPEPTAPSKPAASAVASKPTAPSRPAKSAPAPRKVAPASAKPAASGPATITWSGKKPMVYTFTGSDGKTYSGSRARLPAGTYTFAAAVSGLAPEKQASVVVPKGASSITIHCDEGSKKCTHK